MIYEAAIRKSLRNGKYLFILRRDGRTIRFSDARYLTDLSAVSAAHESAFDAHARIGQIQKNAVVFRVCANPSDQSDRSDQSENPGFTAAGALA